MKDGFGSVCLGNPWLNIKKSSWCNQTAKDTLELMNKFASTEIQSVSHVRTQQNRAVLPCCGGEGSTIRISSEISRDTEGSHIFSSFDSRAQHACCGDMAYRQMELRWNIADILRQSWSARKLSSSTATLACVWRMATLLSITECACLVLENSDTAI